MVEVNTLHIPSTNPITLNYPSLLGRSTIFVLVISSGRRPSCNATCIIIIKVYHRRVMWYLYHFDSWIHAFMCSTRTFDGLFALPVRSPPTSTATPFPLPVARQVSLLTTQISEPVRPLGGIVCTGLPYQKIYFKPLPCRRQCMFLGVTVKSLDDHPSPPCLLCGQEGLDLCYCHNYMLSYILL